VKKRSAALNGAGCKVVDQRDLRYACDSPAKQATGFLALQHQIISVIIVAGGDEEDYAASRRATSHGTHPDQQTR
jgi:hypothetical protein